MGNSCRGMMNLCTKLLIILSLLLLVTVASSKKKKNDDAEAEEPKVTAAGDGDEAGEEEDSKKLNIKFWKKEKQAPGDYAGEWLENLTCARFGLTMP